MIHGAHSRWQGVQPIDISFADEKLQRSVSTERELKRRWGKDAKLLATRLAAIRAADNLAVLTTTGVAGRCHALTGNLSGKYAMSLWGSMRLVFEPADDALARKADGGIDEGLVLKARILRVYDYHE